MSKVCVYFDNKLMRGNRTVKVSAGSLHAFDSPNLPPLARAHVDIDVDQGTVLRPASMARFRVVDTVCQEVPSCPGLWNGYLHDCTGGDAADLPLDHGEHGAALPAAAGARRGAAVLRGRQHSLRQDTPHTPTHGYHTHSSYFNTEAVPRYYFYTQPPIPDLYPASSLWLGVRVCVERTCWRRCGRVRGRG